MSAINLERPAGFDTEKRCNTLSRRTKALPERSPLHAINVTAGLISVPAKCNSYANCAIFEVVCAGSRRRARYISLSPFVNASKRSSQGISFLRMGHICRPLRQDYARARRKTIRQRHFSGARQQALRALLKTVVSPKFSAVCFGILSGCFFANLSGIEKACRIRSLQIFHD